MRDNPQGGRAVNRTRTDELLAVTRAAAAGDSSAAATLVMRVAPSILRVVRAILGRAHPEAEDVAQDAVIAFLSSLSGFRGDSTVFHFADRVALLTALGARRRIRRRQRFDASIEAPDQLIDETSASPLAEAIASRRREILLRLLDELPDVIAEALALHFILGFTVDEVASAANVSSNTVWSRLRLGKGALRRKLERDRRLEDLMRGAS